MARIVVNVMPTAEAPDGEGHAALPRAAELGYGEFTRVRQGLRFVLSVPGELTEAHLTRARELVTQLVPADHEVAAVHAEGATITVGDYDDDWDDLTAAWAAGAPVNAADLAHDARRTGHHDVALDQAVEGYGTGVYTGDDD